MSISRNYKLESLYFPTSDFLVNIKQCMVQEDGDKLEAFSLAKIENLIEAVKSFAKLSVFSWETFLGNINSCFCVCFEK